MGAIPDEGNLFFKEVPESLEDITAQWCELALRRGDVIGSNTTVSKVELSHLVNEETGALDGGGMTSSQMVRIKLTYIGCDEGYDPPSSIIAKHLSTGKNLYSGTFCFRLMVATFAGRNVEERTWRTDIKFQREALPLIADVYSHPKVYYTGIIDGGNRSFFNEVVRPAPHKIRSITLMQDMQGWKSQTAGVNRVDYNQATAILQNVAILHGQFWGNKHKEMKESFISASCEREARGCAHSNFALKKRNKFLSSSNGVQKSLKKMLKDWTDCKWFSVSGEAAVPDWMITQHGASDKDQLIFVLKDPSVKEMLEVYCDRFPKFSNEVSKSYLEMPNQTLLHGDFHNGNHMYLEEADKVKVVAFDFQMVGQGMAVSDIVKFFNVGKYHSSFQEDMDLLQKYHESLVASGVENYEYEDLKKHFVLGCLEYLTKLIMDLSRSNPQKMTKMCKSMFGEEKFKDFMKIVESGVICNIFLFTTSLYLRNKLAFLKGDKFLEEI